ncbi:DUF192 domain-containing protein [Patescibacteria group bacterium]|nr:DUF192 domain-containing protein [Patescibacteria group bacterium]
MLKKILTNPLLLTAALLAIAVIILIIVFNVTKQPDLNDGAKVTVRVDQTRVTATVAASQKSQVKGLAGSKPLTGNQGMLFVYNNEHIPTFFMKGMTFPIDIIWITGDTVTEVTPNIQPEPGVAEADLKRYSPAGPINQVLEVQAGFSSKNGIQPGDPVKITAF